MTRDIRLAWTYHIEIGLSIEGAFADFHAGRLDSFELITLLGTLEERRQQLEARYPELWPSTVH